MYVGTYKRGYIITSCVWGHIYRCEKGVHRPVRTVRWAWMWVDQMGVTGVMSVVLRVVGRVVG